MESPPRALLITLAVSLALNLFLGGAIASWALRPRPAPGPPRSGEVATPTSPATPGADGRNARRGKAGRWLSEEDRALLRPKRAALRQARRAVRKALVTEPYDRAALEQALSELRQQSASTQEQLHQWMLDKAASLSPSQRARLMRWSEGGRKPERRGRPSLRPEGRRQNRGEPRRGPGRKRRDRSQQPRPLEPSGSAETP